MQKWLVSSDKSEIKQSVGRISLVLLCLLTVSQAYSGPLAEGASQFDERISREHEETIIYDNDYVIAEGLPITAESTNENGYVTVYLNRCSNGCAIVRGQHSSIENTSLIPRFQNSHITAFDGDDSAWNQVVTCVGQKFENYRVHIVDDDPGNVSHFEAIVAGAPAEIGLSNPPGGRLGGIAPFGCEGVHNALSFSFANTLGSINEICEVVAHEIGHTFGLQHQYQCEDPMTYLQGCGNKWFQDSPQRCGTTNGPERCNCGLAMQNTHELLLSHLGVSDESPPEISFIRPANQSLVTPGFGIQVLAEDNVFVTRIELYINGKLHKELTKPPYAFNAPVGLVDDAKLEVRAFDNRGSVSSKTINVDIAKSCETGESCDENLVCHRSYCVKGPLISRGLGTSCELDSDCDTRKCKNVGGQVQCTATCNDNDALCPTAFSCIADEESSYCATDMPIVIGAQKSVARGGCRSHGGQSQFLMSLLLLVFTTLHLRRKTA